MTHDPFVRIDREHLREILDYLQSADEELDRLDALEPVVGEAVTVVDAGAQVEVGTRLAVTPLPAAAYELAEELRREHRLVPFRGAR